MSESDNLQERVGHAPNLVCDDPDCGVCAAVRETDRAKQAEELRNRLRRRASLFLNEQDIVTLLNLPADVIVRAVSWNEMTMSFVVHLVSERFEPVADMCEAPSIQKRIDVRECDTHQYHVYFDFPEGTEE